MQVTYCHLLIGSWSVFPMVAFIYPITATMKGFLAKKGHSPEQVEKMHQAWFKAVTLQVTLWSYPYTIAGSF